MPPAHRVRDALERVLSSEVFARSERARDLLRYLLEQDLAGNADRLKGFSIAIDVFGKSEQFDPATDTVVRVQAGRLRDLLDQYYAREGADDPLRIAIPRGSYVPEYRMAGDVPKEDVSVSSGLPAGPAFRAGGRRLMLAGLAVAMLLVAGFAYQALRMRPAADIEIATANGGAVQVDAALTGSVTPGLLPSVSIDVEEDDTGSERVAALLRRGLAAFDTVHFIARPRTATASASDHHRRTDFVFAVEKGAAEGEVHLELQNVATGTVLISRNVETARRPASAVADEIADLLTSVASVTGVIYASLAENDEQTALIRCLALSEKFYSDQNGAAHREAYDCLDDLVRTGLKSALVYSELASLHIQAVISRYRHPDQPTAEQALDYARTAVQLAPSSPYAHRAMGYVLTRSPTPAESLRWTRKAYELNTFDLGMAASYGYALVFNADYRQGTPILQRAVAAASAHPTWWDYGLFLGHFMLDDPQSAANAVSALASSRRAHYVAARLIAAEGIGDRAGAAALLAELQTEHAGFAADPVGFFERGNYPPDLALRLVEALRAAGLAGAS